MQTVLGLLSAIVVVMVFGIEEPRVEGQCRMARARQVREVAARPAAIDAKVSDGKVIVSFAESEDKAGAAGSPPAAGGHGAPAAGAKPGAPAAKPAVAAKK